MSWSKTYEGHEPVRLNKWLAQQGVCSRREAEALIARGQIEINGAQIAEPGHKINPGETAALNGQATEALGAQLTAVLYKPVGYVSAQPEGNQIPAARLLKRDTLVGDIDKMPGADTSLAPLGRLDQDSRGLLLLSEDGVLAKAVIGPDSRLSKEYLVTVKGEITPLKLRKLRHGLELDGRKLRRAQVTPLKGGVLRFILIEGRKRQIRRMCQLVDLEVTDLLRIRIGPVKLAGLAIGQWRMLTEKERDALIRAAQPGDKPPLKGKAPYKGKPQSGAPDRRPRQNKPGDGPPKRPERSRPK